MKKSDKLTREDVDLIEGFVKNENIIFWILGPPLFFSNLFAATSLFGTAGLAERTGIPSIWVTAFGTDYQNTEMYSGAVLRISKNLVHFPYLSFLFLLTIVSVFVAYRFRKAVGKMWKIVESKAASSSEKVAGSGDAKSDGMKKKSDKLKKKDVRLIKGFVNKKKIIHWVFLPPLFVLVPFAVASLLVAAQLGEEADVHSIWTTAFGKDYENTEMYSGAVLKINKYMVHFLYLSFLIVLDISLYLFVIRFRRAVAKIWKIVEPEVTSSNEKPNEGGGSKGGGSNFHDSKAKE